MKQESFMIVVKNSQNNTWQGTIHWVEKNKDSYFRSALEMMQLIDSAVNHEVFQEEPSIK